jgi:tocopherol O-methyltransferase
MLSDLDREQWSFRRSELISRYFDETVRFYHRFWHGPTGALHFGMRKRGAGHYDELKHTNEVLADRIQVRPGDRVLDAGCGVGGSAIWLARERGAHGIGITLSSAQVEAAQRNAAIAGCADRFEFHVCDYHSTPFPDETFDVVWALESSCYSSDKPSFLRESHRVLRPGGRIVIADGFCRREPQSAREQKSYEIFKHGLVLPDLWSSNEFVDEMRRCGFVDVESKSHAREVSGSVERLYWRCWLTFPAALLARTVGLVSEQMIANSRSGLETRSLLSAGVLDYVVIGGRKKP